MNTDRFLTRVWDKLEKKMLYQGDEFQTRYYTYTFEGLNEAGIIASYLGNIDSISFGDRFVPMMCTGSPDKNKKLLYGEDIIKYQDGSIGKIHFNDELGYFTVKFRGDMFTCPSKSFLADCELLGNRFEKPDFMENLNNLNYWR